MTSLMSTQQFNQERPELLTEKHQNILKSIQDLQEIEKYMFQNLERINSQGGDTTAETQAINKINDLSETRIGLFNQLKNIYSSTQTELNDDKNVLANQIAMTKMVEGELNNLKRHLTILGWSFKANTNDSRESPSIDVFNHLYEAGCSINVYDPKVSYERILNDIGLGFNERINICDSLEESLKDSSGILILTEWDEFKNYNWNNLTNQIDMPFILDGRNCLEISKIDKRIKVLTIDK